MKTPYKVDQLFIRACKSKNPYLRLHSIYNRFYCKGAKPKIKDTVIIDILSDIVDEYCPLRTAKFAAVVLGHSYTTAFLPLEKRVLMGLVHQIANSKWACFGDMRSPLWARIKFGGE